VQPCDMYTEWVTWRPRESGSGMVGRSLKKPASARLVDPATNKHVDGEGNNVAETRMIVVLLHYRGAAVPFVIPCQSTLNTFARQFNTVLDQKFEKTGKKSPVWMYLWRLKTRERVNPKGKWYTFSFEQERRVRDKEEYEKGKALHAAVEAAVAKGEQLAEIVEEDKDAM